MSSNRALFEARVGNLPEVEREQMLKAYAECVQRKLAAGLLN